MIIAKIVQKGQHITLEDIVTTFQYSANLKMQFIIDERYKDCVVTGWYRCFKDKEYLLNIDENGIFTLDKNVFKQRGTVEFSFSLSKNEEIIHLGVIDYEVKQSFGNGDAILPENKDVWITVVSNVAKQAIKEDVETVKQNALESYNNAKSALESANNALESANLAENTKEKALEFASNAEQSKNDASSFADVAKLAKNGALESANVAKEAESRASSSANTAKNHLDSVVEKTNAFNADYEQKVNEFNQNYTSKVDDFNTSVEDANSNLDTKIAEANTSIDAKVTTATEQANKAADKATELSEAVDKIKHLEDAVDTKLTQPYVANSDLENTIISDSDEGMLRNLKIYGKCTQNVETDIVPTPSRPVSIVNKKVKANGEYVELRSLKETGNLWDDRIVFDGWINGTNGRLEKPDGVRNETTSDFIRVNSNIFSCYYSVTPVGNNEQGFISIAFYDKDKNFLSRSSNFGAILNENTIAKPILSYNGSNACYIRISFRSYLDGKITVVPGTTPPTSYIAPTVRDYKIVDHVNKKAWIERNVGVKELTFKNYKSLDGAYVVTDLIKQDTKLNVNLFLSNKSYYQTKQNISEMNLYIFSSSGANLVEILMDENHRTVETAKRWLDENKPIFQYQLETSAIEEIEYSESDTTEAGYSFQDTTSPSPTIPSKILSCTPMINLFNINDDKLYLNSNISHDDNKIYKNFTESTPSIKLKKLKIGTQYTLSYKTNTNFPLETGMLLYSISTKNATYPTGNIKNEVGNGKMSYDIKTTFVANQEEMFLILSVAKETISYFKLEESKNAINEYAPYGKYCLDIKTCGKNLFDPQKLSGGEIVNYNGVQCYKYIDSNKNFSFDFSKNTKKVAFTFTTRILREIGSVNATYMRFVYSDESQEIIQLNLVNQIVSFTSKQDKILKYIIGNYNYSKTCYIDLSVTQLEEGISVTEYQQYQESSVKLLLDKPLLKVENIADTIDLSNLTRTNNNYYGPLNLDKAIVYGGLFGNYQSYYWTEKTMPKPKILKNNEDKNNLICDRTVANIYWYASDKGETISIYKDGSADFIAVFNTNRFSDVNEFKRFFTDNPTTIVYPLAKPVIEPLEPEVIDKLKTLKTFYPVTHIFSNAPITFDYKLNMESWHKMVSGQVEDARDIIYNMQVQQNNLEIMQLESGLETQYNLDLLKLGGM